MRTPTLRSLMLATAVLFAAFGQVAARGVCDPYCPGSNCTLASCDCTAGGCCTCIYVCASGTCQWDECNGIMLGCS